MLVHLARLVCFQFRRRCLGILARIWKIGMSMCSRRRRRTLEGRYSALCCCLIVALALHVLAKDDVPVVAVMAFSSFPVANRLSVVRCSSPSKSPVTLFGVRSSLKKKLKDSFGSRGEKKGNSEEPKSLARGKVSEGDDSSQETGLRHGSPISGDGLVAKTELEMQREETTVAVVATTKTNLSVEIPIDDVVTLPLVEEGRTLTKLEQEFRDLMQNVAELPSRDIAAVPGPRLRAILEGARSGAGEYPVYRAFEVLFQDLVPLRIAGRMIFSKLMQEVQEARLQHEEQVEALATSTGMCPEEIEQGRFTFLQIAHHADDGESFLTIEKLIETGLASTIVELLGYDTFQELLEDLDKDQTGKLTFEQIMVGLQQCDVQSNALECNPSTVLQELARRMKPVKAYSDAGLRKAKLARKYDEMVQTFGQWEDRVPAGDARRLDILRGCFVGARNEKVVTALKIVYCDYSALRMAGDLIFGLMCKLMNSKGKVDS